MRAGQAGHHQLLTARPPILACEPLDEQLHGRARKGKRDILQSIVLVALDPNEGPRRGQLMHVVGLERVAKGMIRGLSRLHVQ